MVRMVFNWSLLVLDHAEAFGLPSQVFEAYDEKNHYHYTLKGIEQKEPALITRS